MSNWERDRQLRAQLSAIEATQGFSDAWYAQRERLILFQIETGFMGRHAHIQPIEVHNGQRTS